jgi:hypothetical protein
MPHSFGMSAAFFSHSPHTKFVREFEGGELRSSWYTTSLEQLALVLWEIGSVYSHTREVYAQASSHDSHIRYLYAMC